jgi:hypothetical protein
VLHAIWISGISKLLGVALLIGLQEFDLQVRSVVTGNRGNGVP